MGGECSHFCAISAPLNNGKVFFLKRTFQAKEVTLNSPWRGVFQPSLLNGKREVRLGLPKKIPNRISGNFVKNFVICIVSYNDLPVVSISCNVSNKRKSVSSTFQKPRSGLKNSGSRVHLILCIMIITFPNVLHLCVFLCFLFMNKLLLMTCL